MLGLLVAAAIAATPLPAAASPYFLDDSTIVQITCIDWTGTAFYVGDGRYITARHVVRYPDSGKLATCTIMDNSPVHVLAVGKDLDYAMFESGYFPPYRAIISCKGFQEGRNYYAQGFASGNPWIVTQRLIGTRDHYIQPLDSQFSGGVFLKGKVTQGQSGGPVSDEDGLVVGIVSAGSEDGTSQQVFVALADTPICKK